MASRKLTSSRWIVPLCVGATRSNSEPPGRRRSPSLKFGNTHTQAQCHWANKTFDKWFDILIWANGQNVFAFIDLNFDDLLRICFHSRSLLLTAHAGMLPGKFPNFEISSRYNGVWWTMMDINCHRAVMKTKRSSNEELTHKLRAKSN